MSDDNILDLEGRTRLSADITLLMLKGAGYAAIAVLAIWFTIAVIAAIGRIDIAGRELLVVALQGTSRRPLIAAALNGFRDLPKQ